MCIQKRFKQILFIFLMAIVLTFGSTFAFWEDVRGNSASLDYSITIGSLDGEYSDNPIDNIPSFVPDHIVQILIELSQTKDSEIIAKLVSTIVNIYQYHSFSQSSEVHLAATAEDLFIGQSPNINGGDYLIFTRLSDDDPSQMEVVVVHLTNDYNGAINSANDIFNAIEQSWTGVNQVSPLWISGGLYNPFHSPIEYNDNLYLNINDGNRYTPPSQALSTGTWFLLIPDLSYTPLNTVYPRGHIVKHESVYYVARTAVWNTPPSPSQSWAWGVVPEWDGSFTQMGEFVYTMTGNKPRFWRALASTQVAPSEATARDGVWQEHENGWIGRRGDMHTKSFYFSHNNYYSGDVIIYGISANLKYRYYAAKSFVPDGQPPLIANSEGMLVPNDMYWESWT